MKSASLSQIKKELAEYSPNQMIELIIRLMKHKVENKELVSYLLFDADDIAEFLSLIKMEIDEIISQLDFREGFHSKRGLKKCLRSITKYSKFMASKDAEVELLVHFCKVVRTKCGQHYCPKPIQLIFHQTIEKIKKLLPSVHEDLQNDYIYEISNITK
ncbi:MAG: hypothetical protein U0T36_01055 [Saprospiraceae bacterium]|jgi:hypothetical protein